MPPFFCRKRGAFGTKVSVATTNRGGSAVGSGARPGNPYDGHALSVALEQVEILTDRRPDMALADRGDRGHGVATMTAFLSGARRGVPGTIAKRLRRRTAIEPSPMIRRPAHSFATGHLKTTGAGPDVA